MVAERSTRMSTTMPASKRKRVAALLAAAEHNEQLMARNPPGWLEPYRGQWVVIHVGKVVAHSPDGSGPREAAPPEKYPGALLERVPTREELEGVLVV
jgi:hypothetical protein